jgi:uncharacterized membrane protein YbhN (UPF0104 family)
VGGVVAGPMLWAGLVTVLAFAVGLGGARRLLPWVARRWAARWPRLVGIVESLSVGLAAVGSPRRLLGGWALGLLPVMATALAYALGLRHLGAQSYLLGGGLVVGAVTLAMMTPGLPSSMGLYYFAVASTARAVGVSDESAATLAVLSHAASNLTHVLVGLASMLARGQSVRDLWRLRRAVAAPP